MAETFAERVITLIKQIPAGQVATYGQIAGLAGSPRAAISVGQILHRQTELAGLPWQRVINSQGYISTTCLEHPAELQAGLLENEGIEIGQRRGLFTVDLSQYLWQPGKSTLKLRKSD